MSPSTQNGALGSVVMDPMGRTSWSALIDTPIRWSPTSKRRQRSRAGVMRLKIFLEQIDWLLQTGAEIIHEVADDLVTRPLLKLVAVHPTSNRFVPPCDL